MRIRLFFWLSLLAAFASAQEVSQEDRTKEGNVRQRQEWLQKFLTSGDRPDSMQQIRAYEAMGAARAAAQRESESAVTVAEPQWMPLGPAPSRSGRTAGGSYDRSSGRISAVAVDPRNKDVVYAGAASGGVWKSTDGGQSWLALTDTQASLATGGIAIHPTNPDTIFVGTGENKNNGYWGVGILKSTDGGQSWRLIAQNLASGGKFIGGVPAVGSIAISPDGNRMLAGAFSDAQGVSGVYLSTDGGENWTKRLTGGDISRPYDIVFASNTIAYAVISTAGIFKSTDGGVNWTNVSQGKILATSRIELSVFPADPNLVYAAVEHNNGSPSMSVYKSVDGGGVWTKSDALPDICGVQCFWDMDIAVSPTNKDLVFVGGAAGLYNIARSLDGGVTWQDLRTSAVHVDQQALAFSADGSRLYLGNDGGMYSTETVASSPVVWKNLNTNLQTTQLYRGFDIHPTDPNIMMAGSQDNGTHYYTGLQYWFHAACGDGAAAVISQTDPTISFAGCQMGSLDRSASSRPLTWFNAPGLPGDWETVQFIPLWVGDPTDGDTIYYANHRVWQTRDSGYAWHPITESVAGGPMLGTTYAITPCRADPNIVYVGTTIGTVKRLSQAKTAAIGTVLPVADVSSGLPAQPVTSISVHPEDCNRLVISLGRFTGNRVWYSNNGGATWVNISGNLPEVVLYTVVMDPDVDNTFYVSTSLTVYATRDGGATWAPFGYGLPNAQAVDMKLHRPSRLLRVITHGRGVWDAYIPVPQPGAVLVATPASVQFGDLTLYATGQHYTRRVVLTNIGDTAATLGAVTAPPDFHADASDCGGTLAAGASCTLRVTLEPLDQGMVKGVIELAYNSARSPLKVFVAGMPARLPENDSFATAKVIPYLPYRDRIDTRRATNSQQDPPTGCPAIANKSVWYRYTAEASGTVRVSSIGSDFHTNLSVYTGSGPFTLVKCAFLPATIDQPLNALTFDAIAGTTYAFMVSSTRAEGGTLVFSVDWPDEVEFRPGTIVFSAPAGTPERRRRFEIANRSRTAALSVSELAVSGGFALDHACSRVAPLSSCRGWVGYTPGASPGSASGELTFKTDLSPRTFRIPISAQSTALVLTRSRRSARTGVTVSASQAHAEVVEFTTEAGAGPFAIVCEASAGLECSLSDGNFTADANGVLRVAFSVKSRNQARRLRTPGTGNVRLRLQGGGAIYSTVVTVRP